MNARRIMFAAVTTLGVLFISLVASPQLSADADCETDCTHKCFENRWWCVVDSTGPTAVRYARDYVDPGGNGKKACFFDVDDTCIEKPIAKDGPCNLNYTFSVQHYETCAEDCDPTHDIHWTTGAMQGDEVDDPANATVKSKCAGD